MHDEQKIECRSTDRSRTELSNVIRASLERRKSTIQIQKSIEEAWKSAVNQDNLVLNRPLTSKPIPEGKEGQVLVEAVIKRRHLGAVQQEAFLLFQNLTEGKHEEQVQLGENLLILINDPKSSSDEIGEKTQEFLQQENMVNKEFLRNVKAVQKQLGILLKKITSVRELPCQDTRINNLLRRDTDLLEGFVRSIQTLKT